MNFVKEIASKLDGCILGEHEPSKELQDYAREKRIVIAFGESDDLLELRGAINDEVSAWNGTTILLNKDGLFHECECECECEHSQAKKKECVEIKLTWNNEAKPLEPTWRFETTIPHQKFNIFEVFRNQEKELFCEGIVFCLDQLN